MTRLRATTEMLLRGSLLIRLMLASFVMLATPAAGQIENADMIFVGGPILTVNTAAPSAEALAVRAGRIVAVGDATDVMVFKGTGTKMVDLAGRTLMPGLVEPHSHPLLAAIMGRVVDVAGFSHNSRESIMAVLEEAAAKAKADQWIVAFGWDPAMVEGLHAPSLAEMDAIAPENPLLVMTQTMHTIFVNTRAYQEAGITKDTPAPGGTGSFDKDKEGNLNGTVRESPAIAQIRAELGGFPSEVYEYLLASQYDEYARHGYTTVASAGAPPVVDGHLEMLRSTAIHPKVPLRTFVYVLDGIMGAGSADPGQDQEKYRVLGVKLHIDGSPYAGGMAMREPYLATALTISGLGIPAGSRGHLNNSDEGLRDLVARHHLAGRQVAAHVQGERAIDQYLDAIEAALKQLPNADHRHRLEHNALITDAQLGRAARLGVTPSFYMDHVHLYGRALSTGIVGPDRAARFMPVGWAKKHGHRFSVHTDTPSSPLGPFRMMRGAVTRKMRTRDGGQGQVLGPEQRVTAEDAIRAMTIDAAWQLFAEDEIGSLEVGKFADLVVISDNPLTIEPDRLTEIEVVETYLEGRRVRVHGITRKKLGLAVRATWAMLRDKVQTWF